MTENNLFLFATTFLIIFAIPGPGITMLIAKSAVSKPKAIIALIAGIIVGDLVFFLISIFGLKLLAEYMNQIFVYIKIIGAVYLLWLAVKFWKMPIKLQHDNSDKKLSSLFESFFNGFIITISNPKAMAFYFAILPQTVDLNEITSKDVLSIGLIIIGVISVIASAYAFLTHKVKSFLKSKETIIPKCAALFTAGTGITLLVRH